MREFEVGRHAFVPLSPANSFPELHRSYPLGFSAPHPAGYRPSHAGRMPRSTAANAAAFCR